MSNNRGLVGCYLRIHMCMPYYVRYICLYSVSCFHMDFESEKDLLLKSIS